MRLLLISENFPTSFNRNKGVFVFNLAKGLYDRGYDIEIICPVHVSIKLSCFKFSSIEMIEDMRVHTPTGFGIGRKRIFGFNLHWITHFFYGYAVRRVIRKLDEVDVVYCHFIWTYLYSFPHLNFNDSSRIFLGVGESDALDFFYKIYRKSYAESLNRCNRIIPVSQKIKNALCEFGVNPFMIEVVPNGVNLEKFKPSCQISARKILNFPKDVKILIFIGRNTELKGAPKLIEAFKDSSIKLVLIGPGFDKVVGNNILFKGVVNQEQLPVFLNASDMFVFPTLSEGCPNALLEALATGIPVAVSDIEEIREILCSHDAVFFDQKSVSSIRDNILEVLENNELMRHYSCRSLLVSRRYDLKMRLDKITRIFNNLS